MLYKYIKIGANCHGFKHFSLMKGKPFFSETGGYKVALVRGARVKPCLLRSPLGTRDDPQPSHLLQSIRKELKINLLFFLVNLRKINGGLKNQALQKEYLPPDKASSISPFPSS